MIFVRPVIEKLYNIIKINIEHIGTITVPDTKEKIGYDIWRHPSLKIAELRHYSGWGDDYVHLYVFDVHITIGEREHGILHNMIRDEVDRRQRLAKKKKDDKQASDEEIALSKLGDMIL